MATAIGTILFWGAVRAMAAALFIAALSLIGYAAIPERIRPKRAIACIPASLSAGAALTGWIGWILGALAGTFLIGPVVLLLLALASRKFRTWSSALFRDAGRAGALVRANPIGSVVLSLLLATPVPLLLVPVIDSDGLRYHLAFPKLFLLSGKIFFYPWDLVGGLPQLGETLFLVVMATTGAETAKFLHFEFFLLGLVTLAFLLHRGRSTRAAAILGPLLFAAAPVVLSPAPTAFIDHIALFHLGTAALLASLGTHPLLIGCALGGAVGTKLTSFPSALFLMLFLVFRKGQVSRVRRSFWLGLPMLVAIAPFAVRNIAATGDPFFPVGYSLLGKPIPGGLPTASNAVRRFHGDAKVPLGISWGYRPTEVQPDEVAGWHHLAGMPALLMAIRAPFTGPLLTLVFASIAVAIPFRPPTRLLLPMFWGLAGFEALALTRFVRRFTLPVAIVVLVPALLVSIQNLLGSPALFGYLSGHLDRPAFLKRMVPGWGATQYVNSLPAGGRVMALDFPAAFYFDRPFIVEGIHNEPPLKSWLAKERSVSGVLNRLYALDVRYILVTPGYGGGRPMSLLPLASSRESASRTLELRRLLRLLTTVDGVDIYEVPPPKLYGPPVAGTLGSRGR